MLPAIADLPPAMQERVICSVAAAAKYEIPANIVLAVAENEGGKPGQWVRNSNGTHDVGPMQFNTSYLAELAKFGITAGDVAAAGCYSFELAAWRLRGHIKNDQGDLWTRAANYHSRTPRYNAVYRDNLIRRAKKWADWLETHYVTTSYGNHQTSQKPVQPVNPSVNTGTDRRGRVVAAQENQYVPRTVSFSR